MATYKAVSIDGDVSFQADVDLTLAQYYFVAAASTAGNVKVATGASNPVPIGVLQNAPSAGQEAQVRVIGMSKVFAVTDGTCALAWSRFLTVNASGQAAGVAANQEVTLGRWLDTSAPLSASRFGNAFINCMAATGCAPSAS